MSGKKRYKPAKATPKPETRPQTKAAPVAVAPLGYQRWLWPLVVVVATLLAYSSAFDNQLTNWDDNYYVTENPVLQKLDGRSLREIFASADPEIRYYMGNYHPLAMLSLAIDFQWGGKLKNGDIDPRPYIGTNILLHVANAALVFYLVWMLWGRIELAGIAALLFGVHALHVESVAWISERKDVLYTFFFLLALLAYLRYLVALRLPWLLAAFGLFLLSLLSKGQAVSLAPTLVLIDWFRGRKLLDKRLLAEKLPFFLLALIFGLIAIKAQSHGQAIHRIDEYPFYLRILFASYGFVHYLAKLVLPLHLAAIYPYPILTNNQPTPDLWLYLVLSLAILALGVWAYRRQHRHLSFGLAFFVLNIVLLLQLIPVGSAVMADRYSYIPSIGIHALVAFGALQLAQKMRLGLVPVYGATAAYALLLGVLAHRQADTWNDSLAMWNQTLKVSPKSVVAWNNRGSLKEKAAKQGETLTDPDLMRQAVGDFSAALAIKPDYTTALYNRGVAYYDLQEFDKAMSDFNEALRFDPTFGDAYHNRGLVKDRQNRLTEAIDDFNKAVQFKPKDLKIYVNRGVSLGKTGQLDKAIADFNYAIEHDPQSTSAYSNRGLAYDLSGKPDLALRDYSTAIGIDPQFATAYANRALVYQKLGRWAESIPDFDQAIRLLPQQMNHYYQRSRSWVQLSNFAKACADLRQAQQLGMAGLDQQIALVCAKAQ